MNMKRNYLPYLLLFSLISFCCSTTYLLPGSNDVIFAQQRFKGATLEQIKKGYSIYSDAEKCTKCHSMNNPKKYSEERWGFLLQKMSKKAFLDSTETKLVNIYFLAKHDELLKGMKNESR
jgi:hypothetical protein